MTNLELAIEASKERKKSAAEGEYIRGLEKWEPKWREMVERVVVQLNAMSTHSTEASWADSILDELDLLAKEGLEK